MTQAPFGPDRGWWDDTDRLPPRRRGESNAAYVLRLAHELHGADVPEEALTEEQRRARRQRRIATLAGMGRRKNQVP